MRHDRNNRRAGPERVSFNAAEAQFIAAAQELARAQARLTAAEAHQEDCQRLLASLRQKRQALADQAEEWRRTASLCSATLLSLSKGAQSDKDLADAEHAQLVSSAREAAAAALRDGQKSRAVKARATQDDWGTIVARTTRLFMLEGCLGNLVADEQMANVRLENAQACLAEKVVRSATAEVSNAAAKKAASDARDRLSMLSSVQGGIAKEGFGSYLSRTNEENRELLRALHAEAQKEGKRRSGRRPAPADDPQAASKANRAAQARERRARQRAEGNCKRTPEQRASHRRQRREKRKQSPSMTQTALVPEVRFHLKRLERMRPEERIRYQDHVERSRSRGRTAAIADAALRSNCPSASYSPVHPAIPLGEGARLVAVRGGLVAPLIEAMRTDRQAIEHWLAEPMEKRLRLQAGRGRLTHGALHVVATWSPTLLAAAAAGTLDSALAREVDLFIGRFDLFGHRVAGFLHTDSAGGNPHLHIVASRIRDDDLSLWSLPGRERAVSLWLHARSNTVATLGSEALDDDIDALAGRSSAAMAGEVLMEHARLAVLRRSVDGQIQQIPIQGQRAAARAAAVGSTAADLAGGVWLFGFGESDTDELADGGKQGYWLSGSRGSDHFGEYLSRIRGR